MLAQNPEFWGFAASWDAPFLIERTEFGLWDTDSYGTLESFERQRPPVILAESSYKLHGSARIIISGQALYGSTPNGRYVDPTHTEGAHLLLEALHIPHVYRTDFTFKHDWNSGWFAPLLKELISISRAKPSLP
jgi:hypothetical protein